MYTLDGRLRFDLALSPENEVMFHDLKLQEIVLARTTDGPFSLTFSFVDATVRTPKDAPPLASELVDDLLVPMPGMGAKVEIPEYVMVEEAI
jgi:hypothetical protein